MMSPSTLFFMELEKECRAVALFREVVEHVHGDLSSRNYAVGVSMSGDRRSSISWDHSNGRGVVHIDPRASSLDRPHDAIWDLLHEWGHAIDGPPPIGYEPKRDEFTLGREIAAWNYGWSHASERYAKLVPYEPNFRRRQEELLISYRNYPGVIRDPQI